MKKFTFGFGREHSEAEQGSGCPLYTNKTYKTEGKLIILAIHTIRWSGVGGDYSGIAKTKTKGSFKVK